MFSRTELVFRTLGKMFLPKKRGSFSREGYCSGISVLARLYQVSLVFFVSVNAFAQSSNDIDAAIISSTSLNETLPYEIFEGRTWKANPDAKFVRLDILLDQPVKLGGLEIEFENTMKGYVTIYLNDVDKTYYKKPKDDRIVLDIDYPNAITSVKFNFGLNRDVSVKSIILKDTMKNQFHVRTSKIVEGSAKASSTLEPTQFYDILKVFDSKLENGWSSNKKKSGDMLEFSFAEPQTITALKIWNGYQRSDVHYYANSRTETLKLEDRKGYSQTVALLDTMGFQEIKLSQKFTGDYLKMTIMDSYAGKKYNDLVISELRFFDGNNYFLINPTKVLKADISLNQDKFSKAGIQSLLDAEAVYFNDEGNGNLNFRIRSDGSVYSEGNLAHGKKSQKYFIIGNYEILKASNDGVDLRLFGYIVTEEGKGTWQDGDCGGGGYSYVYKNANKRIFTEFITIKLTDKSNQLLFINTGENHNLNFSQAVFKIRI